MCGGPDNPKRNPPGFAMAAGNHDEPNKSTAADLLELAAADDTESIRRAVEEGGADAHEPDLWYGRAVGSRRMALEQRTPLMIAALYGSVSAARLLLALDGAEPNRACGSDGTTALHCAAAGGAPGAGQVVRLLLDAGADLNSVDAAGNRPGDVIALAHSGKPRAFITDESSTCISTSEKKEYPIDLTLPDVNNGVYSTDEFRIYTYKVRPCSRAYSHDWTECPFVHPGENARRRDPRKYLYSCVPCPEFRKGTCRQGDGCEYAHGVFECWLHPAQYRTRLCKDETNCNRRVCFFAHKPEELRPLYASTGSAMPSMLSPRSMSSALDMAAPGSPLGSPMIKMVCTSTPPMSPSASLSPMSGGGGLAWPSQPFAPPALQLPGSRLKTALNARDMEMDMDLIDEVAGLSLQSLHTSVVGCSPLAGSLAAAAGSRSGKFGWGVGSVAPSNLDKLFGSIDSVPLPIKSSSGMSHSFGGNLPPSPVARSPSPFGLLNSRTAAFAKRSQSFIDRSGISTSPTGGSILTNWGSPTGKLDWGIQGEELQKLRKSASFGVRNSNTEVMAAIEEPDVSWVQSLVKDGPQSNANQGWHGMDQLSSGGAASVMLAPWEEQAYMEQEQMVA